ncbi:MAG: sugar phosphate isomerase/epimerase [Armatimonadetes bacterium]|nr:sugar phosphate isomerase/epimerase [Candidatus Hippobium faecium]
MIKGISYWAFPAGTDCKTAIKLAKELNYSSIELAFAPADELGLDTTKEHCEMLKAYAEEVGIKISSLCSGMYWGESLTDSDPAVAAKAIENTKKYLEVASWIGVDSVLVIPGSVATLDPSVAPIDYELCYAKATEAIKTLIPFAEKAGVCMALENVWNKFLLSPKEMKDFIDQFDSPFVGSYFDVGNCMLNGFPEQWIKCLGKRIKKVHFKDFKMSVPTLDGFVELLAGDVDWKTTLAAFDAIGYDGFVTAEMFPYEKAPMLMVTNTSNAMDVILGK